MMDVHDARATLRLTITKMLEQYPELFQDALDAITAGHKAALEKINKDRANTDMAFRIALSLAHPKRMTKDSVADAWGFIAEHISPYNHVASPVEKEAVKHASSLVQRPEGKDDE